ncbi:DNA glycosylase [Aspergillus ellipticus CBS 707.79]|uniref:DNA glycosylase n=1 Tax=Aspergillus ellipticus CBS 707.79 TaxID=1448320 RepID=A0A319DIY2_9EURO|nr:DNA glycosylase [Aspergillus ellipticus CBS 707.79]
MATSDELQKISPYFPRPLVDPNSCLPFPPIDTPSFGLVQEQLAHDPFRLLIATIFLNRTRGGVALPVLFRVFDEYPTITAMAAADTSSLASMINCLGFQNQRAKKCISLAQTWLACPPTKGKRYRKLHYPCKQDGRDIRQEECIDDSDSRVAWEIAHLPGVGPYSLDSWRIFCRDELRGVASDWTGQGATARDFVPEWKSVLPQDKELRAYVTWMWLKEGWVWDRHTGKKTPANAKTMRAAHRGGVAHEENGNWALDMSPPSTSFHMMFLPLRLNDRDRDRDRDRKASSSSTISSKSKQRKNRGPSTRTSTKERDPDVPTGRSSTTSLSDSRKKRRSSMPGVDSASRSGTASFLESRTSLPYPSFSKAHSKEAVGKPGIPTPDPTDLTEGGKEGTNGDNQGRSDHHQTPPSPPLTSVDQQSHKGSTAEGKEDKGAEEKPEKPKTKIRIRAESTRSSSSLRSKKDDGSKTSKPTRSETPKTKRPSHEKESPSRTGSRNSTKSKIVEEAASPKRTSSHATPPRSPATARDIGAESTNGSDATIAPPNQSTASRKPKSPEKPPSRTQTRSSVPYRQGYGSRTPVEAAYDYGRPPTANSAYGAPPPPPPPPEVPVSIPKVDYLLQNGGLDHRAQKSLLAGLGGSETSPYSSSQPQLAAGVVFDPFNRLLDDFNKVMTKNGSLAVATGYRSVARRLLDRLEAVFARDISSESCHCLMCDHEELEERPSGVSWGELPSWPPFILNPSILDGKWSGEEHIPMQKLDIDVPEEYRDHFIRQSRKTKVAVDRWLKEVDDETLTFAILTHLGSDERPLFSAFLGINSTSPTPRPEGQPRPRPAPLVSSSLAIQRMYRLNSPPRDPEAAIYMLNNPGMHHVLATLAAISDDEWDILISEDAIPAAPGSTPPRWSHSRSNTPFTTGGISRGPTPGPMDGISRPATSFGGPIALDEEMEIAALAEIERDIYLGMEALEDAFEALHCRAEVVRRALRERSAGLSLANQNRRGSYVEARLGTPASGLGVWDDGGDDDFLDDAISLAPDDSASNISSNRRRRPKRRTERRTPAPVEEEDEEEVYDSRRGSRRR